MSKYIIVKMTADHIKIKGGEYVCDYEPIKSGAIWTKGCEDLPSSYSTSISTDTEPDTDCSWGEVR